MANALLLSSKVIIEEEDPQVRPILAQATAVIGLVGITERGPIAEEVLVTSADEYKDVFGGYTASGEVAQAIDAIYGTAGPGVPVHVVRTVHFTDASDPGTKTSAAASLTLNTAATAPTSGSVLGSVVGPFNLAHNDNLSIVVDGGSPTAATFTAVAAARESAAETFALSNGQVLTVSIDSGSVQTIAFLTGEFVSIGAATAEEVASVINAKISGASASVTSGGTKVTITSDKKGTASGVDVTGGSANTALAFTTGNVAGTGNVADIDAVTVAEVETIVEAAVSGLSVTNVGGAVKITSNTTGTSSSILVQASSSADDELGFDNATHSGTTGAAVGSVLVEGKYDGTYANSLSVAIEAPTNGESGCFNLVVIRSGVRVELFPNLSVVDTDARYVETIVNGDAGSKLISVSDLDASITAPGDIPATGTFGPLTGGDDGLTSLADADFIGGTSSSGRTGLRGLDLVDDLSLLAVPGRATPGVHGAMAAYCETLREGSVFGVFDPPANNNASQIITYVTSTASLLELTEFAAIYWPRLMVTNPSKTVFGSASTIAIAPSGMVLGAMARTDSARQGGVYEAPAGIENGRLPLVLGFEGTDVLDQNKRDLVYPKRINPITTRTGLPKYIDGSRTLKSSGNFPSVSERRGVILIEQSIKTGLEFARHKNNDDTLRSACARIVTTFLTGQMKVGAFRTRNPSTAFFVDFGTGLNTPAVIFANQLKGRVGLATQKPAEFVIVSFSQDTRSLAAAA